jgi:MFS family permease
MPDDLTLKQRKTFVYYLCLIGFFGIFSTTISKNPVLPLFVKSLGGNTSLLGFLSALSPLAGILFSFPIGFLADSWGKKRLLLISAFIFVTAPLLYLFIINPWFLIPVRFFHGLATAILGPVASAIICGIYPDKKAESLGLYSSATLVGRMIAPLLGGFIIGYFSSGLPLFNYRLVYLTAFILALPVFFLTLKYPDNTSSSQKLTSGFDLKSLILSLKNFQNNQTIFLTSLVQMATYFIYGVYETYLPLYLVSKNISAPKIGLVFSLQVLSIAVTQPFFGKLADRIDKRIQITFGILLLSLTAGMFTYFSSFISLVTIGLFFGLGMSFCTVATGALVADLAKKEELGTFMGALSSMMDIGQTFGPFLIGFVITTFSIRTGFLISSILAIIIALLFSTTLFSGKSKLNLEK